MLLSNAPRKVALPFAENGDKNTIPEDSSPSPGFASMNDGFPPLTRQPVGSGGIPPQGLDMNGILNYLSALNKWQSAGGSFVYDSSFANDTDVNGYPNGAILLRADGTGFWLNQIDDNDTNPDLGGANWQPINNVGITAKTLTSSDVTLTNAESAKDVIVLSGVLTANVNLIVPTFVKSWIVANNTSGAFSVTVKTVSGTGEKVSQNTSRLFFGDGTNVYGVSPLAASQSDVNTGTNTTDYLTPKTFNDAQKFIDIENEFSGLFDVFYPVGITLEFAIDSNPNTIWPTTTWTRFAEGQTTVGYKSGDSDFGTVGTTGGAKSHTMTLGNLIEHDHERNADGLEESVNIGVAGSTFAGNYSPGANYIEKYTNTAKAGNAIPTPIPTLMPFRVTAKWQRTA